MQLMFISFEFWAKSTLNIFTYIEDPPVFLELWLKGWWDPTILLNTSLLSEFSENFRVTLNLVVFLFPHFFTFFSESVCVKP